MGYLRWQGSTPCHLKLGITQKLNKKADDTSFTLTNERDLL